MKRVVNYLMSGPAHMPYLVVSLSTLRNHYDGEVVVYAYPNCYQIAEQIASDPSLDVTARPWNPEYEKKNSQFVNKILLLQQPGYDVRLYLDADTSIHGDLEELFNRAYEHNLCVTQFNHWVTTGTKISNRIIRLRQFPKINQKAVEHVLKNTYPSPNGGIVAARPSSKILPVWYDWSWEAIKIFICDESVLQIMQAIYDSSELYTMTGGKYNCSHKFGRSIKNPHIYHYHGNSCVRPSKSPEAVAFWMSLYEECLEDNIGNVEAWRGSVRNRHMNQMKKEGSKYAYLI